MPELADRRKRSLRRAWEYRKREDPNITQEWIAERVQEITGDTCTKQAVSGWIRTGYINGPNLLAFAKVLRCDAEKLNEGHFVTTDHRQSSNVPKRGSYSLERAEPVPTHGYVPIFGDTERGPFMAAAEEGVVEYLAAPSVDAEAYALRVVGSGLYQRYKAGQILHITPSIEPTPGDEVVVQFLDGEFEVRALVYWRGDEIALDTVPEGGPRAVHHADEIEYMHRVEAGHSASSVLAR